MNAMKVARMMREVADGLDKAAGEPGEERESGALQADVRGWADELRADEVEADVTAAERREFRVGGGA